MSKRSISEHPGDTRQNRQTVMTVRGGVSASELGVVLCHEHVFINLWREYGKDGILNDADLASQELAEAFNAGCRTVVDCTTSEIGRDPEALVRIAEATGLNIIMGTGHYRHPYLDRSWVDRNDTDGIASAMVREIEIGIADTGIRAGIIGEMASNGDRISASEERTFRAAARAQLATGVTITTHAACWPVGDQQLDILESEGVDPRRVIIGHCDTVPDTSYHLRLARRGAYVQLDTIRSTNEYERELRIRIIFELRSAGLLDRVLLSQDVCLRSHLVAYGGSGYAYLQKEFVPLLRHRGLSDSEVATLLVENPRRALTGTSDFSGG